MRIATDTFSNTMIQQIQTLSAQQSQYQQELSSGTSITNPSDNPAMMDQVLNMQSQMQSLQQISSNNNTATQITQQSYSALSNLQSISTTASELATEGATGTTSPTSYAAYSQQLTQLISQALDTANTQYNGSYIFGGTQTTTPPFTASYDASGNITGVTYTGSAAGISMETGQGNTVSPYTDGTTNQQMADFINNLVSLQSAMNSQSTTAVQAVQSPLQTSEDQILTAVSGVGAIQSGLQADQALNQSAFTSLQGLVSDDTSTDVATTTVQFSQAQAAYQAALTAGAKILEDPLVSLLSAVT
jgi:flagellar hook-associated protein 3 FlgL